MKFLKYFLILLAGVLVTSCEDKDNWNSAPDVTVEMADSQFTTKEGRRLVNVPIIVKGNANGRIKIDLDLIETTTSQESTAKEDVHYYATSKTIYVDPQDKTCYLELSVLDDRDINEDRTFIVKIASVEGATVGQQSECLVIIRDNDSEPYDRMEGEWYMIFESDYGTEQTIITLSTYDEDEPQYERMLKADVDFGYGATDMKIQFSKSAETISILADSRIGSNLSFGGGLGVCNVVATANPQAISGSITARWNDTFDEVNFGNQSLYLAVVGAEGNENGVGSLFGIWQEWTNIRFVRVGSEESED